MRTHCTMQQGLPFEEKKSSHELFNFENWFLCQFSSNIWFFLAEALSTPQKSKTQKAIYKHQFKGGVKLSRRTARGWYQSWRQARTKTLMWTRHSRYDGLDGEDLHNDHGQWVTSTDMISPQILITIKSNFVFCYHVRISLKMTYQPSISSKLYNH